MPPAQTETQVQLTPSGEIQLQRFSFREAEQNSYDSPPAQNPDKFMLLENVLSGLTGNLQRRWGYKLFETVLNTVGRRLYEFQRDSDGARRIILTTADGTGGSFTPTNTVACFDEAGASAANIFSPAAGATHPRCAVSRSYAYFVDGVAGDQKKWSGPSGTLTKWGITPPVTAISVGAPTAGAITLTSGRNYFVVFKNSTTLHHSDLNPVSASTGPISGKNIPLTNIEVSGDAQVDRKIVLATADGGNQEILYFVADLANATTTLTDSVPESTLLAQNIFLETDSEGIQHGVADNAVPPNANLPIKHRGRLYMAQGQFLRFSKNLDEVTTSTGATAGSYEESWPADYQLDISEGAENVRALMSDGNVLYIGTERHIRRLLGDGPTNFQTAEVVFNEAGVLSQETWKVVFLEGQPLGTMWLTPDLRVIGSDFNTYKDVGTPIQDVLNSINTAASSKACAAYYAIGSYNFFLLAIPTGSNTENDTLCVYDLKFRKWYVWRPTDSIGCMLNNVQASGTPQLIFYATGGKGYKFDSTGLTAENLLLWSQDFSNAANISSLVTVTPNTGDLLAPDGTSTATKLLGNHAPAADGFAIDQPVPAASIGLVPGQQYTFSVWLRTLSGSTNRLSIFLRELVAIGTSGLNPTITTSWQRFSVTRTVLGGGTGGLEVFLRGNAADWDNTVPAVYAWGAQLEHGAVASTYVPTTSSRSTITTQDRVNNTPVSFNAKAQTSWLDIQGPGVYKALNVLRVLSNDSSLLIDVDGAVTDADFASPISIVSGQALRTGPTLFSEKFFPFFTTKTRYKFYRFTFRSAGTSLLFLDGYDLRAFAIR